MASMSARMLARVLARMRRAARGCLWRLVAALCCSSSSVWTIPWTSYPPPVPPLRRLAWPPPGHPERLACGVPPTPTELALWARLPAHLRGRVLDG